MELTKEGGCGREEKGEEKRGIEYGRRAARMENDTIRSEMEQSLFKVVNRYSAGNVTS